MNQRGGGKAKLEEGVQESWQESWQEGERSKEEVLVGGVEKL